VSIVIRRATEADLESMAAIQAASPEAAQWLPPDYLIYECRVAGEGGCVEGFVCWRTVATGEHELLNVAVAPGIRRRGIGQQLVRTALASAPGRWFLEVRESNVAARSLYRSMGFTEEGVRHKYYENPQEPGIVMSFCS
jgi:ribosomal-protein-alanine N-acetyltransferase